MIRNKALFYRLCQSHRVHYRFEKHSSEQGCIDVDFMSADCFQQRIQFNRCPKKDADDDMVTRWAGKVWHFPVKQLAANERYVIMIPEKVESIQCNCGRRYT